METRIGQGYDIHKLKKGRRLVIGGVEIEFEAGLEGHSDADVVTHAVIDALLGAAALGDIGSHFPDTDPRYKDADSISLLESAVEMMNSAGWVVGNVDVTVLAEQPKLAQYIPAMRENLARALRINRDKVSIKAKTNEGLDSVGRAEAIAAYAVTTVYR